MQLVVDVSGGIVNGERFFSSSVYYVMVYVGG